MREAFGGAFMIRLVLVFIVLYTCFMAVAVNYAKVFRIKNRIINLLEQSQYKAGDDRTIMDINDYLEKAAYIDKDDDQSLQTKCLQVGTDVAKGDWVPRGACIVPNCSNDGLSCYYTDNVYLIIEFPLLVQKLPITIKGETKTIVVR